MILKAAEKDLDMVVNITHTTISGIYSRYYAMGVVDFFLKHHNRQNILADIENGIVWMLEADNCLVGTVTVKENAVNRLFVLPEYQSRGFGSQLMDFAEKKIAESFDRIYIDSSLAAKEMYLKRGYKEKQTCKIIANNGDILVYDEMEKMTDSILRKYKNI
ncbi:MAG: GNAT family N-acetyltransferase [Lachnospiraceae bacterium]|nr:GNAT family N-acetyltransferase [Lachnospiraceae bacterium]